MRRKRHILVAGWVGSENTGDEAIFASLLQELRWKGVEVRAFSINEKKTARLHRVKTVPFEIWQGMGRFLKAIKWADVLLVGGGGILQDQTSIFNTPRYLYKAMLGRLFGKKVIFYAVGAGPVNFGMTKWLLKAVLNRCQLILVRDEESKKLLVDLGVREDLVKVSFDPAVSLLPVKASVSKKIVRKELGDLEGKKIIGICLRHWFDINPLIPVSVMTKFGLRQKGGEEKYKRFAQKVARVIEELDRENKYIFWFIPYWYSRDKKVHQDIIEKLPSTRNVRQLKKAYTPEELLGIFGQLDMVLAMRLHACIYAASMATPFVALSYSKKVNNFLKEVGVGELKVEIESFSTKELKNKLKSVLGQEKKWRKRLETARSEARKKESLNGKLVRRFG